MSEPLGAAVTDEFPAAVGLHELLDGRGSAQPGPGSAAPPPASPPPAPAAPVVELPPDLLKNTLIILDTILSSMVLKIEPEPSDVIDQLERSLHPLAQYYAQGHPTVAVLWTSAAIALAGYGYAKYEKVAERRKRERAATPPAATPPPAPADARD
jgi:hypothetical protein